MIVVVCRSRTRRFRFSENSAGCCLSMLVATARVLCRGLLPGHNRTNPRHEKHAVATRYNRRPATLRARGYRLEQDRSAVPGASIDNVASSSYIEVMKSVGLRELKNRLSEYVREVRSGEGGLVTDRGEVVAELIPPGQRSDERGAPSAL